MNYPFKSQVFKLIVYQKIEKILYRWKFLKAGGAGPLSVVKRLALLQKSSCIKEGLTAALSLPFKK